jgi:uncharacterized protein YndB with AHSA1/START domain
VTRLRLEKLLFVPPERTFAAFVDADQFRTWWGPAGFTVASLRFDVEEGGEYRIAMQPPEGDVFHIRGRFLTVESPRRLAYTFVYEEPHPDDVETDVTLTFEPADPGTRLTVDHGPFRTEPRRELHRVGWTETLDRLERSLLPTHVHAGAEQLLERLHRALNQHDLPGFVGCFSPKYRSEQPAHPNRGFGGREQVEKNWAALFAGMPDFHAELVATAADGDTVWAEWRWSGTRSGEPPLDMGGVTVFGVEDGLIAWGRLYMEEVEAAGEDIDKTVRRLAGPPRSES